MAKQKRRKASLHSAGRVTEQDLLERARELLADPTLAIPICEGGCVFFSPTRAAQREIPRIHAKRDDDAALTKASNRGNDLARAYAATLLLAKSGKVPVVADIRLGNENVPYVVRGKTKPFFLAGVQHHDDRALRLLSVASWARKRGMNFYSADRGIVCTGKRLAPPEDFIAEEATLMGLERVGDDFTCGHEADGVLVRWRGTPFTFTRCESCAGEGSTMQELLRHIAGPKPSRNFEAESHLLPLEARAGNLPKAEVELATEIKDAYLGGRLSDSALLEAARSARVASLRTGGAHFVAGNISYGDDVEAFLADLSPNPDEERALRAALAVHTGAVVIDRPSLARAVAELWPLHGHVMLSALSDEAHAKSLYKDRPAPDEAVGLLRKAARHGTGRLALANLPQYVALPAGAAAADAIARAYRSQGRDAAVRAAQERANLPKAKSISLAMLTALQARQGQDWRFSQSDADVADSLAPHVELLLTGPPESYHDALVATSRGAGETAPVTRT